MCVAARVSHVCVYCCVSLWHTWCQGRRSRHCFGPFGDLGSNHWGDKFGETPRSQVAIELWVLWGLDIPDTFLPSLDPIETVEM